MVASALASRGIRAASLARACGSRTVVAPRQSRPTVERGRDRQTVKSLQSSTRISASRPMTFASFWLVVMSAAWQITFSAQRMTRRTTLKATQGVTPRRSMRVATSRCGAVGTLGCTRPRASCAVRTAAKWMARKRKNAKSLMQPSKTAREIPAEEQRR